MIRAFLTFAYVGLIPLAPGTWGSAAAIPVAWVLHGLLGFPGLALATCCVLWAGIWAVPRLPGGVDDPSEIVIDEVVGMWIALWPLSYGLWHAGAGQWAFPWPGWVVAFLAFRLFDIWKPWLVGRADRMHGGLGVMLDDVAAGVMAALVVAMSAFIAHGLMRI